MNDLDLERRLTEAFDAKAEQLVPSRTVVPPLDLDGPPQRTPSTHRTRRIWIGTGLVAAAAAIVVAAVTVGSDAVSLRPDPVTPAEQTTPPAPAVSTTPTAASPSPSTSPTDATPPAATTHAVEVDGVTLQVPTSWQLAPAQTGTPFRCLSPGGVAPTGEPGSTDQTCDLSVAVQGQQTLGQMNADTLSAFGDPGRCDLTTVTADQVTIDGQVAEHRVFTGSCLYGIEEQWAVLTTPTVVFTHDFQGPGTDDTRAAQAAVVGAQLPGPRSTVRVADTGIPRAATATTLTLDRVTVFHGRTPQVQDLDPATYSYTFGSATTVAGPQGSVPLDRFIAMVNRGDYTEAGIDGAAIVTLATDGTTVTTISVLPTS